MDCSPPGSSVHWDSPGKNTGVGCHALLQGIFPTQGSNSGLSNCKWILYHLSYQGSLYHYFKKKKKKRNNKLCIGINKSVISLEFEKKKKNETCQTPLSFIIAWSLLKFLSIESVMLFNHLILFHPLLLLSSVFPSIRVFSNESALWIRWPKYWIISFSTSPSSEYSVKNSYTR